MVNVKDPKKYFYAHNGAVLKNLDDLLGFLVNSEEGSVSYHFGNGKNDFAPWVKEILKKAALSKKLIKSGSREDMISAVEGELKKSRKKVNKKAAISAIKKSVRNIH